MHFFEKKMKRFFVSIIVFFGVLAFEGNLLSSNLHRYSHGGEGHAPSTIGPEVCPVKGDCPHHKHSMQGMHGTASMVIKCQCKHDLNGNITPPLLMAAVDILPCETLIEKVDGSHPLLDGITPDTPHRPPERFFLSPR